VVTELGEAAIAAMAARFLSPSTRDERAMDGDADEPPNGAETRREGL
jgi:hypothetical protein